MASARFGLTNVMLTSAKPRDGFWAVPLKITSSIEAPRSSLVLCSPRVQRMASKILLLPHPLGPTTAVMPGSKLSTVRSANDLNPKSSSFLKYIFLSSFLGSMTLLLFQNTFDDRNGRPQGREFRQHFFRDDDTVFFLDRSQKLQGHHGIHSHVLHKISINANFLRLALKNLGHQLPDILLYVPACFYVSHASPSNECAIYGTK